MLYYLNFTRSIVILKNNNKNSLYIMSSKYFLNVIINDESTTLNKETGFIELKKEIVNSHKQKIISDILNNFLYIWDFFFFDKIN